jgi:hypothetical protein
MLKQWVDLSTGDLSYTHPWIEAIYKKVDIVMPHPMIKANDSTNGQRCDCSKHTSIKLQNMVWRKS